MSKRFAAPPSELLGVRGDYERWCIDEACMYLLCRIEQEGRLPRALERMTEGSGSNARTVDMLSARRSVRSIDLRQKQYRDETAKGAENR